MFEIFFTFCISMNKIGLIFVICPNNIFDFWNITIFFHCIDFFFNISCLYHSTRFIIICFFCKYYDSIFLLYIIKFVFIFFLKFIYKSDICCYCDTYQMKHYDGIRYSLFSFSQCDYIVGCSFDMANIRNKFYIESTIIISCLFGCIIIIESF